VTAEAYIPQQTAAHPPAPAPVEQEAVVTKKPKALVVDDEDSNAALVRRALDIAGYDVESTTLSRRALVMIERRPYDVIIADVRMPELNGQELYARACAIRPELARRFIFVTGDIDGDDTLEFLERSQCGYFMKPFNLERLTTAVDMLVGGDPEGVNRLS
jgi:DNA-binding response OmpR family regulator